MLQTVLQEKIEVGVEHAVVQLMGLFGGAGRLRQFWGLLFDHALTISTILSPSLDRDEVGPGSLAIFGSAQMFPICTLFVLASVF